MRAACLRGRRPARRALLAAEWREKEGRSAVLTPGALSAKVGLHATKFPSHALLFIVARETRTLALTQVEHTPGRDRPFWIATVKIVIVINVLSRGGAERVVCRLTKEWAKRHDVRIAVFSNAHPAFEFGGRIEDLRVPASTLVGKVFRLVVGSIRLAKLFREVDPDRIISFMEGANFPAIFGAVMSGDLKRLWVSVRNNPIRINLPYLVFMPLLYRLASRIVAPSEGVRDGLARLGLPRAKLFAIRNPVVVQRSGTVPSRSPLPYPFILGAGKLHRQKGFDRLLRSFRAVNSQDLRLVLLGDGAERGRLTSMANRLGIGSRVHFPGASTEVERWFHHALCFVLSSRYEGSPNILIEAMAHGCPVVSFDCRYGPSEIFEDGISGLLVAQNDVTGLSGAITRILTDADLRRRLAYAGSARGRAFSIDRIAPLWLADERAPSSYSATP